LNDGFVFANSSLLASAGEKLGREDFVYIGTRGSRGASPQGTSMAFKDAGLYVMRSDWTEEARYLLFDSGPYGGPHGHEDKLSFEIFAFGRPFIVDAGSYTYDRANPFRDYFVSSHAHNTVLVDGRSQVRRWNEINLDPQPAVGNHAAWVSAPSFDYVRAVYDEGYGSFTLKVPEEPCVIEDVSHTRHIFFVKPDYWVIIDELQALTPHSFQLLFHAAPDIHVKTTHEGVAILHTGPAAACLCIVPANSEELRVSCIAGSESPIQGWYSSGIGLKEPTNVVIYESKNGRSAVFATVHYPYAVGQPAEIPTIEPLSVSGGKALSFQITANGMRDYLMASQNSDLKEFGTHQSSAAIVVIRTDHSGRILARFDAELALLQ
jgi:hypothetical protein